MLPQFLATYDAAKQYFTADELGGYFQEVSEWAPRARAAFSQLAQPTNAIQLEAGLLTEEGILCDVTMTKDLGIAVIAFAVHAITRIAFVVRPDGLHLNIYSGPQGSSIFYVASTAESRKELRDYALAVRTALPGQR